MTQTMSERVLERLKTHGWLKGDYGRDSGPNCLLGACVVELEGSIDAKETFTHEATVMHYINDILNPIIQEQYGFNNVPDFNDESTTTFADIERVLDKARVKELEAL